MLLTYSFSRGEKAPLYQQLYEAIRRDILSGRLSGGEKLPSKRALAEHLGVSKITVENAYHQLLAEGYLTARERSGYYVEELSGFSEPAQPAPAPAQPEPAPAGPTPAAGLFPFSVWARLMRSVILDEGQSLLQPTPGQGLFALRQAIAQLVQRQRGMTVEPEQIVVGAGAELLYNLLIQFLGRSRRYALEELGHRSVARIYRLNGVAFSAVSMDAWGVLPEAAEKSGASVLHITPAHHYPTGIVTPIARRQQLMAWLAAGPDRYLIEDDYDAEFRFSGRPIPSMQSQDDTGRILYMNTFSRTIAPALRVSYLILPKALLPLWREKMGFYSCTVPAFEQLTLTRFLQEGHFERHLRRMKKHYRLLRAQVTELLEQPEYRRVCTVQRAEAGLHFVMKLHTRRSNAELRTLLSQAGLEAAFLADFYVDDPPPASSRGCIVLSCAGLDFERFRQAMERLRRLL